MDLVKYFNVEIVTQNIDDLNKRSESSNVIHLHSELLKVRSYLDKQNVLNYMKVIL